MMCLGWESKACTPASPVQVIAPTQDALGNSLVPTTTPTTWLLLGGAAFIGALLAKR